MEEHEPEDQSKKVPACHCTRYTKINTFNFALSRQRYDSRKSPEQIHKLADLKKSYVIPTTRSILDRTAGG